MKKLLLILSACAALRGAGSVSQVITQIGSSPNQVVYQVAFSWTGDASTGSVPVTPASGGSSSSQQRLMEALQGTHVVAVETVPGTPSPTNGYGLQILDNAGVDVLNGAAASVSNTTHQAWAIYAASPPIGGTVSLSISGQSVASAKGTVYVFFAPVALSFSTSATGGGGSGTVTSLTLTGTANQITISGCTIVTTTGACTFSIPTNPTLPGNTTGTFIGNLTGTVTGSASLDLLKTNNLSDLASAATARTNLGLSALATTTPGTGVATALAIAANASGGICTVGGSGCPGTGTVSVVGAGNLTSTALVTGGGSQALQTPAATATMDSSGNISTPGTVSTSVGSGNAGAIDMAAGTSGAVPSNSFGLGAPATMTTSVRLESPNAVPTANSVMLFGAPTSNKATWTYASRIGGCEPGLGDGLNAISAGTFLQTTCGNIYGATLTITSIRCFTDNNGTSTMSVANGAGTALLTGAVTCTNSKNPLGAAGTQSGTTTIASGDSLSFTFVADGTSKQTTWVIAGTY